MKKIKLRDGSFRTLPDVLANILIKNKGAVEVKKEVEKLVKKEDKTIKQNKQDKQIKKRSTK